MKKVIPSLLFIISISCTKLVDPIAGISNKVELSTNNNISNIGSDSAIVGGNITKDGGETITERGVVWNTSTNPTISNYKRKAGSGLGAFTVKLDQLLPLTEYFARVYSVNIYGTNYGQQVSFKTLKKEFKLSEGLKNGLVASYTFDGSIFDDSPSAINGVLSGGAYVNNRRNTPLSAIEFTSTGFIRMNSVLTNVVNNFSISIWALTNENSNKYGGYVTAPPLLHPTHGSTWGNVSENTGAGIYFATNQIRIVEHSDNFVGYPLIADGNFTGWTHIVMIYENNTPRLYVNGKFIKTGIKTNFKYVHPSNGIDKTLYADYGASGIGRAFNYPQGFIGKIDDFRIWNRVLTENEIKYLFEN